MSQKPDPRIRPIGGPEFDRLVDRLVQPLPKWKPKKEAPKRRKKPKGDVT